MTLDNQTAQSCFYVVVNLMLMALCIHTFGKNTIEDKLRKLYLFSVIIKIGSTISVAYIFMYSFEYSTDPQTLFSESVLLTKRFMQNPKEFWPIFLHNSGEGIRYLDEPRTFFYIKINSLLNLFTGENYWINSLWISLLCFFSTWKLAFVIQKHLPPLFYPTVLAFLFVPTTCFWTSGLLKETISMAMLCLITSYFIQVFFNEKILYSLLLSTFAAYILFQIKFYVLGAFLLVALSLFLVQRFSNYFNKTNPALKITLFLCIIFFIYYSANVLCTYIYTVGITDLIFYNYEAMLKTGNTDFVFPQLREFDTLSFAQYVPEAIWQGLFMPLPWNTSSLFTFSESIPNLITLLLSIYLVFSIVTNRNQTWVQNWELTSVLLLYVLFCSIAIAFSTPNWGTLARYKVMYMPFFHLLLFFYCSKEPSLKRFMARF